VAILSGLSGLGMIEYSSIQLIKPMTKKVNSYYKTVNLSLVVLIFAIFSPAHAQMEAYRIGQRDVITLTVYAGGELQNQLDLTVSEKGTINIPFIGSVNAAGRTILELENRITKPLAQDYFVNPEVNVSVKEYHSLQYFISGAVESPGLYEMTSRATLLELLAKAGGVLPTRGNVAYIQRKSTNHNGKGQESKGQRPITDSIKVDLKKLLDQGDMSQNRALESGDVVYIPPEKTLNLADSKIYVGGEVKRPGLFDFQPGLTALSACIMAGGFTKFAAPNRTRVIRHQGDEKVIIKINLNDVKNGKIADVKLLSGDRIQVPQTWL
jgi:polysaccharide export outer membrane protein